MLGRNFDSYYDPPEEPEIPICEDCGQDMEIEKVGYVHDSTIFDAHCANPFCPAKFEGSAKEMAEKLVDTLDTVSRLEMKVRILKNQLGQ